MHWHIQRLKPTFWVEADFWVENASMSHPINQSAVDAQIAIQDTQTLGMVVHLLVPTVDQQLHVAVNRLLLAALLMVVLYHHADTLETHHATMMNKSFRIFWLNFFLFICNIYVDFTTIDIGEKLFVSTQ